MSDVVLVTGAAGLLGQHIVRQLLLEGSRVRCLLRDKAQVQWLPPEAECVIGDIRDAELVFRAAENCRFVFHACCTHAYSLSPSEIEAINIDGTKIVCEAAKYNNCQRLIFTSTISTTRGNFTEADISCAPPRKHSTITKKVAEDWVLQWAARNYFPVIVVNPSYFIGPFDYRPSPFRLIIPWVISRSIPLVPAGSLNVLSANEVAREHLNFRRAGELGSRNEVAGCNITFFDYVAMIAAKANIERRPKVLSRRQLAGFTRVARILGYRVFDDYVANSLSTLSSIENVNENARAQLESCVEETVDWFTSTGAYSDFFEITKLIRNRYL